MSRRSPARGVPELAERWLLAAARDRTVAQREWRQDGVTLLRCGELFGAIRLSYGLVHAAAGTSQSADVVRYLRRSLRGGAVFAHPRGGTYYALISLATSRRWAHRDAGAVGTGTYLGVPALERVWPYGLDSYWAVPPTLPSRLCGPAALDRLVATGLDARGRSGEAGNG